jgi:low temperature requirement protein LtrA
VQHRVSTPLELLTDLCFVVAVAQASAGLHHAVAEDHVGHGVISFGISFFAIWWTWLNFSWFASAYDNDEVGYRLLTILQIIGVLLVAAGIPGPSTSPTGTPRSSSSCSASRSWPRRWPSKAPGPIWPTPRTPSW